MRLSNAEPSTRNRPSQRPREPVSRDAANESSRQSPGSASTPATPPKHSRAWFLLPLIVLVGGGGIWIAGGLGLFGGSEPQTQPPSLRAIPPQYDQQRVFGYLVQLCDLGPRPSGSAAMEKQRRMLAAHFQQQGANVTLQTFEIRHPNDGTPVSMANLIASWHPERPKRFLLCAHYDTRPYPDRDRVNKRGTFIGANDGASGTAALAELAHHLSDLPTDVGVDLVLFDGEEFVFEQGRDEYFLGSKFFAEKYRAEPPSIPYQAGVLLDMVGDRELKIYYETNSLRYAPEVTRSIWATADDLGVTAFVPRRRHTIDDDHIPLNEIAKIPTTDLIDFDYPRPGAFAPKYWHTEQDIPANCSGRSLAAVVWVVHSWLKRQ